MATPTMALRRVRQARREEAPPRTTDFETYQPEYRTLLSAMRDLGGDPAIDELAEWMVDRVHETGRLPAPNAVRDRGRAIADELDLRIPDGSPLRER